MGGRSQSKVKWYAFLNINGSAVAHNIFLVGNVFRKSPSVPQKHFVAEFRYGISLKWRQFRFSITEILQTKEFDGQLKGHRYGALRLTWFY